jgi:hypothetical protein
MMSARVVWHRVTTVTMVALCAVASAARESGGFSGQWRRNEQLSQSALGAIEIVLGEAARKGAGGRANTVFSPSGIFEQDDIVALRDALVAYARGLHSLSIVQTDQEVQVQNGQSYVSLLYLDGEKHLRELPDGIRLEVTARREGPSLWVEQKSEAGDVIQEHYSLLAEGSQMAFRFHLESKLLDAPVFFRIVYDRVQIDE